MVFYFSGTGNSLHVADMIAESLGERLVAMAESNPTAEVAEGNSIGFVTPVYSWGIPSLVLDFISRLPQEFVDAAGKIPVWCVLTCGDETGMAPEVIAKALERRGLKPAMIASVIMPNNYVLLPGFNVDSKDVERSKLEAYPKRVNDIVEKLSTLKAGAETEIDVHRGPWPRFKTRLVYPLFRRWGIFTSKWHHTEACVGCSICAKACPVGNVKMQDGHPVWGSHCESCLACYHSCPRHAVAYGTITRSKGQYFYPLNRK